MGRYDHWTTCPSPRRRCVPLPAVSPGPALDRLPSSQTWPTTPFPSHRQIPAAPAPNYQYPRTPDTRTYSTHRIPSTATYDSSMQYGSRDPRTPSKDTTHRPPPVERTKSMTSAPLKSILKSSRPRSQSISYPEASGNRHSTAPIHGAEPRKSNLSQSQTVYRTKPLKPEAISLSWPLVQFNPKRRSRNPLLYFDVGCDPKRPMNLRDNRSGQLAPMSEADRNLPVSTHCTLTEMVVECPQIGKIYITEARGILCIDVFSAVYDAYHEPLKSFQLREDMGRSRERAPGARGVDLLKGQHIFNGLSRSGAEWKLDFYP
ncbi:hypothetical protein B0H14DRAFT_892883 [Mycena olivaceomarginata]|nr:hypothetical protein B0H14DRAFT_892883 [Mycena olivaceomarginata]